jgi:hypothetical protein
MQGSELSKVDRGHIRKIAGWLLMSLEEVGRVYCEEGGDNKKTIQRLLKEAKDENTAPPPKDRTKLTAKDIEEENIARFNRTYILRQDPSQRRKVKKRLKMEDDKPVLVRE